jgi:hypothetical protein
MRPARVRLRRCSMLRVVATAGADRGEVWEGVGDTAGVAGGAESLRLSGSIFIQL